MQSVTFGIKRNQLSNCHHQLIQLNSRAKELKLFSLFSILNLSTLSSYIFVNLLQHLIQSKMLLILTVLLFISSATLAIPTSSINSDIEPASSPSSSSVKAPSMDPMSMDQLTLQFQDAFADHILSYLNEKGAKEEVNDAVEQNTNTNTINNNINDEGVSVKASPFYPQTNAAYGPQANPAFGGASRCPGHPPLSGNAIPLPPNLAGAGIAGPLLWQIGSSAENLAANLIGSLAGGIISGLGLQGYLGAGAAASASAGGYVQDNPLIGRGVFDATGASGGSSSGGNPLNQLSYIVTAFLNSDFAGKLISILSSFVNSSGYQNPHFG